MALKNTKSWLQVLVATIFVIFDVQCQFLIETETETESLS